MPVCMRSMSRPVEQYARSKRWQEKKSAKEIWNAGIAAEKGDLDKRGVNTKIRPLVDGSGLQNGTCHRAADQQCAAGSLVFRLLRVAVLKP